MLYAPVLTPELEKQHRRHAAARQRIAAKPAHKPAFIVQQPVASVEAPVPEKVESWVDRQKRIWFWIESDLGPTGPITMTMIQNAVCEHFNLSRADLLSQRRAIPYVRPRQIAMYLCKTLTQHSLPEIGRHFAGRDHTTALSAVRRIASFLECDPELAKAVEILTREIKGDDRECVPPSENRRSKNLANGCKATQPSPRRDGIDAAGFDGPAVEARK